LTKPYQRFFNPFRIIVCKAGIDIHRCRKGLMAQEPL